MGWIAAFFLWIVVSMAAGCAGVSNVPLATDPAESENALVVGRAVTVLLGPTTRWYLPRVRFIELTNRATGHAYQVMIESRDRYFMVDMAPGDYEISRVQISEGPFMSLADLHETFTVLPERVNDVGIWRFGIDVPKYGRKVLVSVMPDDEARREATRRFASRYPDWADRPIVTSLPDPAVVESRLYEVAPYPRISRYFRRHWW